MKCSRFKSITKQQGSQTPVIREAVYFRFKSITKQQGSQTQKQVNQQSQ